MEKEIKKAYNIIWKYESELRQEKHKQINQFELLINKLINQIPTGDLRNDLCDLNILFHSIKKDL